MALLERESDAISPTAHYTGEVWRRAGLSDPALGTTQGRLLHAGLRPAMALSAALGGDTLEAFLLARHRLIDELVEAEVASGRATQVIELAAGMSPRGLRLTSRHPDLIYVEGDLPAMAARKRDAVARAELRPGPGHRVAELDALAESGPLSLPELGTQLDHSRGLAVITEGLLNYFPRGETDGLWRRIAAELRRFADGVYLSDIHLASNNDRGPQRAFGALLGIFVRGRVHFPYRDSADAEGALRAAGFSSGVLHPGADGGSGPGVDRVHVIEARCAG
jgi:O-methyltransferase involved in polyketide biosynthesis